MLTDRWTKSRLSGSTGGGCVEARFDGETVQVRDSKDHGAGPILTFTQREWVAFMGGVALGDFDIPGVPERN